MKCSNCGGNIQKTDEKCGFCGAMNYHGARKKYMNRLYSIKNKMDDTFEESEKTFRSVLLVSLLKSAGIIVLTLVIAILVYSGEKAADNLNEKDSAKVEWKRFVVADSIFPVLDELYAKRDFAGIAEVTSDSDVWSAFSRWEHYDIYHFYSNYERAARLEDDLAEGKKISECYSSLSYALEFVHKEHQFRVYTLDDEEMVIYNSMYDECVRLLELAGFDGDEGKALYDSLVEDSGYLSPSKLRKVLEEE